MNYSKMTLNDLFLTYAGENSNMDQLTADSTQAAVSEELKRRFKGVFDRLNLADTTVDADLVYHWFLNGEPEED